VRVDISELRGDVPRVFERDRSCSQPFQISKVIDNVFSTLFFVLNSLPSGVLNDIFFFFLCIYLLFLFL